MTLTGVYPILWVPDENEADAALALANTLLEAGARTLQLRAKGMPDGVMLALARALAARCREAEALFIVNDRVDIARLSGAGGVHLGADDLPVEEARRILKTTAIIGRSTDTPREAAEAAAAGADYVAWGSVFPTDTKSDAAEQSGPAALRNVRDALDRKVPLVAIGGIDSTNIAEVAQNGANAAAVISALRDAADPGAEFARLAEAFAAAKPTVA